MRGLVVPTRCFLTNAKGRPVLSRAHQHVLRALHAHLPQMVLTGALSAPSEHYLAYLDHLYEEAAGASAADPIRSFATGYEDVLQSPLQPLAHNLGSTTYDVFERDPVKYALYEQATVRALQAWKARDEPGRGGCTVMVMGAGRGPLVSAALRALGKAGVSGHVFAIEKNPFALVTLHARSQREWGDKVTVVSADMRNWTAPAKADVLISELLGSFGDNELSPECLDGAQVHLAPGGGVSIPHEYTAFLAPVHASPLRAGLTTMAAKETPYVVYPRDAHLLAAAKPCFVFSHPTSQPADNYRYMELEFTAERAGSLSGFLGACVIQSG